jgi:hypothetical protein
MEGKMSDIRNDSQFSLEEVAAILADGVEIQYGEMMLKVERRALDDARHQVQSMPIERLNQLRNSVHNALRRSLPKMRKGNFSRKTADNFHADLLLWQALKERAH